MNKNINFIVQTLSKEFIKHLNDLKELDGLGLIRIEKEQIDFIKNVECFYKNAYDESNPLYFDDLKDCFSSLLTGCLRKSNPLEINNIEIVGDNSKHSFSFKLIEELNSETGKYETFLEFDISKKTYSILSEKISMIIGLKEDLKILTKKSINLSSEIKDIMKYKENSTIEQLKEKYNTILQELLKDEEKLKKSINTKKIAIESLMDLKSDKIILDFIGILKQNRYTLL